MYKYTEQIYKEMYYHELGIKEMIQSRISVPLGAISVIATIIIFMLSEIIGKQSNDFVHKDILICFLIVGGLSAVISLVFLMYITFKGWSYRYVPRPSEIDSYIWV